jgi:tRNA 2-thiouridine synthesizing protein A
VSSGGDDVSDDVQHGPVPAHDRVVDERGSRCPVPIITLARAVTAWPQARLLLLADDAAALSDVPAWCALRGRVLEWTGPAPDGAGHAFLVAPPVEPPGGAEPGGA